MLRLLDIKAVLRLISIMLIFQACNVVKKSNYLTVTIEGNQNIVEGVAYSLTKSNTLNNGRYIFKGHGLKVIKESDTTLQIQSIPDSIHFLKVYKVFKSDTCLIHSKKFNVLPMPRPLIRWGELESQNRIIEISKNEIIKQKQIYIDPIWQKSTNLKYEIVAVELSSTHSNYYISFLSGKIPVSILKGISEYSGQNKIIMAIKIKCPDNNTRIYSLNKTIVVKN